MKNLLTSKLIAWIALALVVVIIITTFRFRPAWWAFVDEFFAFMMVFCQLVAVYLLKVNSWASKKLQIFAAIFGICMILSFIGEYVAYTYIYSA